MKQKKDQCGDCSVKGDLKKCIGKKCDIHTSWHTETLREIVGMLQKENDYLKKLIEYINKVIIK